MIYLIGQFWLWLLAAFALGLAVGWLAFRERNGAFWRGLIPWAVLLGVGALVVAARLLREGPAFWVELGMLMTGCYFIGCYLGDRVKGRQAERQSAPATVRIEPALPPVMPQAKPAPAAGASAAVRPAAEVPVEPMSSPSEPVADNAIEQAITGLSQPRNGQPDALTRLVGIDAAIEAKLHALGLYHFDQIAALSPGQRRWLLRHLGFEGRFPSGWWRWSSEARQLAEATMAAEAPVVPVPAPSAPAEAAHDGVKPAGIEAPRAGKADDLKRIRGIGPQNEGRLHALGIWHFDQIAGWSADEVRWVGVYLAFPGRIEREDWVGQAKVLATGASTDFAARVDQGLVPTSADDGDQGQDNVARLEKPVKPRPKKPS